MMDLIKFTRNMSVTTIRNLQILVTLPLLQNLRATDNVDTLYRKNILHIFLDWNSGRDNINNEFLNYKITGNYNCILEIANKEGVGPL